jgi:predicted MPP superfamily phosphohydrolase
MKLSLLHISDLDRDPANAIGNVALLDSLDNDRGRYLIDQENPVRSPDLIIVSGDIVQGVSRGTSDPETALKQQYDEALAFMNELAYRFLNGDRQRVVLVPGNHDVSAHHFFGSLKRVDIATNRKKDLVTQLFSSNSTLRWSWSDFELYEVADATMYTARLSAFAEFYKEFYQGRRSYSLNPAQQFDLFDYPQFGCNCSPPGDFARQVRRIDSGIGKRWREGGESESKGPCPPDPTFRCSRMSKRMR